MYFHLIKLSANYQIMIEQTAVVIGATGLIGHILVEKLLEDDTFKKVRVLVRHATEISHHKLEEKIVDFNMPADFKDKFGQGEVIFCCVGTTQKKVGGDKAAYRKVDVDIPVNSARIGFENNFKKFLMVSSVGADENSRNFYLKMKGEAEKTISRIGFDSTWFFRPSILLGERNEFRSGEKIAKGLMRVFSRLLVGGYKKYRAIDAGNVAAAMINESKKNITGIHHLEYDEIMRSANEYTS